MADRTRPAAAILAGAGFDVDAIAGGLAIDPSLVAVAGAPGWVRLMLRRPYAAIALPWGIYLRREVLDSDPDRLGALLVHELVHMEQWGRLGAVRFTFTYLGDYLRHRLRGIGPAGAYLAIDLEREARERAADLLVHGGPNR